MWECFNSNRSTVSLHALDIAEAFDKTVSLHAVDTAEAFDKTNYNTLDIELIVKDNSNFFYLNTYELFNWRSSTVTPLG